ncbi:MAG: Mur ligase family protein [Chloroflexota bacterium]
MLTNVSSDHMDLQGIHTLPELAQVKSVIARITRPDGVVVLNADDDLVAGVALQVRARVWLFSMRPASPRVRRILARGGRAYVLDGGELLELEGTARRPVVRAAEIPATGGLARTASRTRWPRRRAHGPWARRCREVATGLGASARRSWRALRPARCVPARRHHRGGRLRPQRGRRRGAVAVGEGLAGDRAAPRGLGDPRDAHQRQRQGPPGRHARGIPAGSPRNMSVGSPSRRCSDTCAAGPASRSSAVRAGIADGGGDPTAAPVHPDEPSAIRALVADDRTLADTGLPGVLWCCAMRTARASSPRSPSWASSLVAPAGPAGP